jgi:CheY-like chemotaxis protein
MSIFFRDADLDDGRVALRRYAAAFVGSAARAEHLVEAAEASKPSGESRVAYFRRLHRALLALEGRSHRSASALGRLPPLERAALLLTTLEGFNYAVVAAILELDHASVRGLLQAARQRLNPADRRPVRVAIFDDSPADVRAIVEAVCSLGHRVCGIAGTLPAACRVMQQEKPDLVLTELVLGHGACGLAAVRDSSGDRSVPVVFVTRHAQRLIERDGAPALLLAKPLFAPALAAILAGVLLPSASARPREYPFHRSASGASARLPRLTSADRETASFPLPAPLLRASRSSRATVA